MPEMPANLTLLHQGEEILHQRTVSLVEANADLADHLSLTERVMDVLDLLRQHYQANDDERTISHLGIRVFNSFATAWKLMASGYYQPATLILRDIVETTNLVNAFRIDRTLIEKWRKADRRSLKRDFGPASIRKILDNAAGLGKSRREEIYIKFSTLAGHPTVDGFSMLRPKGMDAQIGPFSDITALRAVMEEMGMLALQTGFAFVIYLDRNILNCNAVTHHFLNDAMDRWENYLGKQFPAAERVKIDRLFARSKVTCSEP